MTNRMESPFSMQYMQLFDTIWNDKEKMQDVTDVVVENITSAYNENSPEFIYFMTLFHVFSEFLDDISEDVLPNEATGFKQSKIWNLLYDFQKDAVLAIINKLEKYNGCILADSVGLGKTFTALAVVKYYENRNKTVLVLCPKKLAENWNTYKDNYVNNPIATDRLNYDVLFHTDLSRNGGMSNGLDLDRLNWGNYDLVVIDESHNFRNGVGTIGAIDKFEAYGSADIDMYEASEDEFDMDDGNTEYFTVGKKVKIDLADMDYKTWRDELKTDAEVLELLTLMVADITPEYDTKLQTLFDLISKKIENPINEGNKKIIIFSAFSDTAEYLYENVSVYVKRKYGLDTAIITGAVDGKSTIKGLKATLNNVLTCFSPISKGKAVLMPNNDYNIDILIATDCISEGQNLQDCDYLVNYDIHWNPVRIIQRFGRIDRIGSKNNYIQLVNFWPDMTLDDYINLKSRVETRMKISIMTSTGDDDLINDEEKGDLEYRKQQLKRLQEEVVDIEEMSDGISIMDLGLNEFRLDLLEYMKTHPDMDKKPRGLHAVVPATEELPEGVIFVLKNVNNSVNIDNQNRIHPFYMVYMGIDGSVVCDYLNPKQLLDDVRLLCRGKKEPIKEVYSIFNEETDDGRDMSDMSELLSDAINSIIDVKEENDIDSLFSAGGTSALMSDVSD